MSQSKRSVTNDRELKIVSLVRSGNQAEITIPDYLSLGGYNSVQVEWDWSPSAEDIREFDEKVYPERVVPVVLRELEQHTGKPHEAVWIGPGLCAFVLARPQ